jgi:biopolymer transport protein ExbD
VRWRRGEEESTGPGLAPLIDVVLLLLIFFLVTTRFVENSLEIDLPEAASAEASERSRVLVVDVSDEGAIEIEGRSVPSADLAALFAERVEDVDVLEIRADRMAPHYAVVDVLDAARLSELERVRIAADGE